MTERREWPEIEALIGRSAWQESASCRGTSTGVFFPSDGSSTTAARNLCRKCPVVSECLRYALDNPCLKGVWAGTSERTRRAIRRQHAAEEESRVAHLG